VSPVKWACVVAALGAVAVLLLDPASADLAAQQYRSAIVRDGGLALWDNGWFAGHHTPAYSLLFPPLGALIGVRLAGVLAALAAAALFARIAETRWGARAGTFAAVWFAGGAVATLASGRLTFLLGAAIALAAVLALQAGRPRLAATLAFATALASPVAGLFLALGAVAWTLAAVGRGGMAAGADTAQAAGAGAAAGAGRERDRLGPGALVVAAALLPIAALSLLFPEGGTEPFVASAFWPALAAVAVVGVLLPARERALRIGALLYALLCVAAFVVDTPLGGNVTRLGALLAGPLLAGALLSGQLSSTRGASVAHSDTNPPHTTRTRARAALLATLALALVYWSTYPAVRDVVRSSGDPSTRAAYHAPLVRFLKTRPGSFRVEIPFTENHWEADYVARSVPLARGWERQLDRRYGALFYDGTLTAATYRAWLDQHAVAYVALPDVDLDYSARAEARLIAMGLPYLRPAWHNAHWRVFAVRDPAPLAGGVARTTTLQPDGFTIRASGAGNALVRVRHTRWWSVTGGRACVSQGAGGMTLVRVLAAGTVRVRAELLGSRCRR
jgi:hypothetical protein